MRLAPTFAIVLRQGYLIRGSFSRVLPLFLWVTIDIVMWGFMTKYLNKFTNTGFSFVPSLLGAVLVWDFFIRVMQGLTTAFFEDVWSRNFLNVFATPLKVSEYVGGLVITGLATSAVGLVTMLILASAVFGLSFASYGVYAAPFLGVLLLFGIALGIFACAVVLRLGPAAEWFVWPIPALLSPFAGVFYPLATLPPWMQVVGHCLPPSYVFEAMRSLVGGGAVGSGALLSAFALTLFYLALACWFFKRIFQGALRSGLIARYSAESLS